MAIQGVTKVLVVDDSRDAADSLSLFLAHAGNEVRTAYDGCEALAIAATFQPDIAFLDIELPDMDGTEIAKQMRLRVGAPAPLLVATTALGSAQDRDRIHSAGFDHYLQKPFRLDEVSRLIDRRGSRR